MKTESSSTPLPSNRSFGVLFVVVFGLVGGWSLWRHGSTYTWWFAASGITAILTIAAPSALLPFNRAWMKLAELLGRFVSPLVLGVLFYGVVTPFGAVKRATGWDPMRKKFDSGATSYWVQRDPPGPQSDSFKNQY